MHYDLQLGKLCYRFLIAYLVFHFWKAAKNATHKILTNHCITLYGVCLLKNVITLHMKPLSLGVCQFNNGFVYTMTKMFEQLDIPIFPSMLSIWKKIDNIRVEKANHKELNRIKLRRK